jgi:hypothetical protein
MLLKNIIGSCKSWSKKSKSANRKELEIFKTKMYNLANAEIILRIIKIQLNAVQVVSFIEKWTCVCSGRYYYF